VGETLSIFQYISVFVKRNSAFVKKQPGCQTVAMDEQVHQAAALVTSALRVVVLTGAGISTDSGIPDFRGPDGLWTKNPDAEKASHIDVYVADQTVRENNWRLRASGTLWPDCEPNPGHRALVALEQQGRLCALVTQNVDGLHQKAGSDPENIIEVHGNVQEAVCLQCDWRASIEPVLNRVRNGETDPHCSCGGLIKSATILFGQSLVESDVANMFAAVASCDLLLAVGTTLGVYPVAGLVPQATSQGAKVIIVNGGSTEMDSYATVIVEGSISELLPQVVGG
jgi:NAD-dependent deacetylase